MGFTKRFGDDPLGERAYVLVYGESKIGKTRMVLDLVKKHGEYVVLFSLDRGTMAVRQEPDVYQGKLAICYPRSLNELRKDMREASSIVAKLAKGVPRSNIWIVIDHVTHLQSKLLAEARKINVLNPSAKDTREEYVRDAVTEPDWNVNLGHMSEVADFCVDAKCNVVVLALEREERIERKTTGRVVPRISGQSYARFVGDADAVLRLQADPEGQRYLTTMTGDSMGGDRSGYLEQVEAADLRHIQQKMIGRHLAPALPEGNPVEGEQTEGGTALAAPPSE